MSTGPSPPPADPRAALRAQVASSNQRFGRWLAEAYPGLAINATFSFLGVLMAFVIGNAWQVRTAELSEASTKLRVLGQVAAEIGLLREASVNMQQSPPLGCRLVFQTPRWRAIRERNEDLLLDRPLVKNLRKTYAELALAPQNSMNLGPADCQQAIGNLVATLDERLADITRETNAVAADLERVRGRVQTNRGLVGFLAGALALSGLVLLVPVALYAIGRLVTNLIH